MPIQSVVEDAWLLVVEANLGLVVTQLSQRLHKYSREQRSETPFNQNAIKSAGRKCPRKGSGGKEEEATGGVLQACSQFGTNPPTFYTTMVMNLHLAVG